MLEHGCTSHPSLQLAKLMSWKFYYPLILLISNIVFDEFNIKLICRMFKKKIGCIFIHWNLDYSDALGVDKIVQIIEGLDNQEYKY